MAPLCAMTIIDSLSRHKPGSDAHQGSPHMVSSLSELDPIEAAEC